MVGLLSKERIVAKPGFNRWLVPPASIAIHLCIGSVYAWGIYNPALMRTLGVVTPAAEDWLLSEANRTFTIAIVFLGLSAAIAGKWLEDVGPRMVGTSVIINPPGRRYLAQAAMARDVGSKCSITPNDVTTSNPSTKPDGGAKRSACTIVEGMPAFRRIR